MILEMFFIFVTPRKINATRVRIVYSACTQEEADYEEVDSGSVGSGCLRRNRRRVDRGIRSARAVGVRLRHTGACAWSDARARRRPRPWRRPAPAARSDA